VLMMPCVHAHHLSQAVDVQGVVALDSLHTVHAGKGQVPGSSSGALSLRVNLCKECLQQKTIAQLFRNRMTE
jgi:hypothetical protein